MDQRTLHTAKKKVNRALGFSLIELLAVLVILAIIAALVASDLRSDPHRHLESAAKKFMGQMELISEEAALRGMEFGLLVEEQQYQFVHWNEDEDRWQKMPIADLARTVKISEALNLEIQLTDENDLVLMLNEDDSNNSLLEEDELIPQVAILSSGEITPFELAIKSIADEQALIINYTQTKTEISREHAFF